MDINIFKNGYLPSEPDERDYLLYDVGIEIGTQDDENFIVDYLPNVYNQGRYGQCCAFSLAKIKEAQELKERGVRNRYSNSYIYANRLSTDHQGEGMYPRQALKMLSKYGVVEHEDFDLLNDYPTVRIKLKEKVSELLPLGLSQRIKTYVRLTNEDAIMTFLKKENTPALYCVELFDNFKPINGVIPMPQGRSMGGHAMIVCGWKTINGKKHWIISNSWSENWGDKGYCYIPFDYPLMEAWGLTDRNPVDEVNKKQKIIFVVDSNKMYTDSGTIEMDTETIIHKDRAMVSVRYLAEALGVDVDYREVRGRKIITLTNGGLVE